MRRVFWIVVCSLGLSLGLIGCGDTSSEVSPNADAISDGEGGEAHADVHEEAGDVESAEGSDGAVEELGAEVPFPIEQLSEVLPGGDTLCARGTPFRFFVYPADPEKVVIDFQGGGACWSELTCGLSGAIFSDSTGDLDQFQAMRDQGWLSGIYDFDNPDNPFSGWTVVHIPYCTGDIHWGDATVDYSDELTIHHRGYRNAMAVFEWVKEYYPGAQRVVSTGCSAGAYGAIGHAPKLAELYPEAELTVIADGGSGVITDDFLAGSFPNWNAEANMPLDLDGIAGRAIEDLTLVDFYVAVAKAFPDMRVAQHTTAFDKDQIFYYSVMGGDEAEFNTRLEASLESIASQADNFRYYLAPGPVHCIHPYDITYTREVGGVAYADWLRELVDGAEAPETVTCGDTCRDDPVCEGCAAGTIEGGACGWCDGWEP